VGTTGIVKGIDASPEMIAMTEKKATSARAEVSFQQADQKQRNQAQPWAFPPQ
jgi:ubiquinone/menaquinone biosynthesis C-methylase UbiE